MSCILQLSAAHMGRCVVVRTSDLKKMQDCRCTHGKMCRRPIKVRFGTVSRKCRIVDALTVKVPFTVTMDTSNTFGGRIQPIFPSFPLFGAIFSCLVTLSSTADTTKIDQMLAAITRPIWSNPIKMAQTNFSTFTPPVKYDRAQVSILPSQHGQPKPSGFSISIVVN